MIRAILARARQGHRTTRYPLEPVTLPERFRGYPRLNASACPDGCRACADSCPYGAISCHPTLSLDMGRCLFCRECGDACPQGAIELGRDALLAANTREFI